MILKKFGILLFAICLVFGSCKKDPEIIEQTVTVDPYNIPKKTITASLSGMVVLEDGSPAEGATVYVEGRSLTTDENGVFYFKDIKMNEYGTFVKVEKPGYFMGAKMVNPKAGQRAITNIRLMNKVMAGTVTSSAGGTVTANNDSKIYLQANGVVKKGGGSYEGVVNVYARWIDPAGENLAELMPGDLRAINSEEESVQLATYGMLAVELEGSNGEALQVAEGKPATLNFPVPEALRATAPATIPLWSYNENNGYWIEEGKATFFGDEYEGEVSHFSFWNCDAPFSFVHMEGTILEADGSPASNRKVRIIVNSNATTGVGWTDENGVFSGYIPKDETLSFEVDNYIICSEELYSETIGPFSSDVVLPTITLPLDNSVMKLKGDLLDCTNVLPITNGYLKVFLGDDYMVLYPNAAGKININLARCEETTIKLIAYDLENLKQGTIATYDVTGLSELDFVNIVACEDLAEFINFTIDGASGAVQNSGAFLTPTNTLKLYGNSLIGDSSYVDIILPMGELGTQNPVFSSFGIYELATNTDYSANCQGCNDFTVTVTAYGGVGEFVEGNFTGTMPGTGPGGTSSVTGSFKVLRSQ